MDKMTRCEKAFYVVAIALSIFCLFCSFCGCAGPVVTACHERGGEVYTHERPTQPFHVTISARSGGAYSDSWTADGAPTVLTVHNPTSHLVQAHVVCEPSVSPTYIDYGHIEWWTCLEPHTEKMRLTEFMNVDAISQVCHVSEQWRVRSHDDCIEHQDAAGK